MFLLINEVRARMIN